MTGATPKWASTLFTRALHIRYPIIQAPCAGHTSPALVAAVSNAGGLGSLGAAMMSPDVMRTAIRDISALTQGPFAVNLFCRPSTPATWEDLQRRQATDDCLDAIREQNHLPFPSKFEPRSPPLNDQIAVILQEGVKVVSFTFGTLPPDVLQRLRRAGVYVIGTATTVAEATLLARPGPLDGLPLADAVLAQGLEAGGHRGTFLFEKADEQLPTRDLIQATRSAFQKSGTTLPLLAAGGISTGQEAADMLVHADGVALGTLFMLTAESLTPDAYRQVLRQSTAKTKLTRALTGRYARGYPNAFMQTLENTYDEDEIPSYDIQSAKTKDIAAHAVQTGNTDYMMLWSGTRARQAAEYLHQDTPPASEAMTQLVKDMNDAFSPHTSP